MSESWNKLSKSDARLMLAANVHIGDKNCNFMMRQYVYDTNEAGNNIFNLDKVWQKLLLAARAIAAIETHQDVACVSMKAESQRACLKFARYAQAFPFAGRFTPGTFTNQIQRAYREPRLLVVHDVAADHQAIIEASYVNIPVVAFCDSDSRTRFVDIVIPCNNKNTHSVGLMWWLLTREVMRMRGLLSRETPWDVMVDLFFYRNPDEIKLEEQREREAQEAQFAAPAASNAQRMAAPPTADPFVDNWDNDMQSAPQMGGFSLAPGSGAVGAASFGAFPPNVMGGVPPQQQPQSMMAPGAVVGGDGGMKSTDWGAMATEDWNDNNWG